jgi:hypothetical protein
MKPTLASVALAVLLLPAPLYAQEAEPGVGEGFSLLEEGAKLVLRGMLREVQPTLEDMQKDFEATFAEMGPALRDLAAKIDDIRNYEAPEILPNGDIIIRRKRPYGPPMPEPNGEIEL